MKKKIVALSLVVALVAIAIVGASLAYFTDKDEAMNTFTVGKVDIKLDEAKVDVYGNEIENEDRVQANEYKLIPGHEYTKDPTVTVEEGSEPAYIRMLVSVNKRAALDAIFAPDGADLTSIFLGTDAKWVYAGSKVDGDTRVYEFRYSEIVDARDGAKVLPALFTSIKVPSFINGDQLKTIEGLKIDVVAQAIQADTFANADAAWTEFN